MSVGDVFQMQGVVAMAATGNTGDQTSVAIGKSKQLLTSNKHGRHYAQAYNGKIYHGMTAVTGVAPGTAVGTTAAFSLYNSSTSTVNLVVLKATMAYISGTLGIGIVSWVANTNSTAAATTGTAITVVNGLLSGGSNAVGAPFTTATLPATPTVVRPFGNLPPMLATSVLAPWILADDVDGAIVVAPGCTISLEATAGAGTSPVVVYGITWEEVPV